MATSHVPLSSEDHPHIAALEPLTAEEIREACRLVLKHGGLDNPLFASIVLIEPRKQQLFMAETERSPERLAKAIILERSSGQVIEAVVSLDRHGVEDWTVVPDVHPQLLPSEYALPDIAAKADPRFQAGLRRRGITDLAQVRIDPVMAGHYPTTPGDRRVAWAVPYFQEFDGDNHYARPIENLRACVDLLTGDVVSVVDGDAVTLPTESGRFDSASVGRERSDLRPLEIVQRDGPSFQLRGHEVGWQNWVFHASIQPIEGLVLHNIRYRDGERERPIVYRAGLSEMVVPYGDPSDGFYWRNYLDAGEGGLGRATNSLMLGCDCVGEVRYLDAVMAGPTGQPDVVANAICIHEEDFGILWKHYDWMTNHTEVRRSRRLVVSSIATLGNYDYGFFWYFYLDGTIEFEIKLTGVILTKALPPGSDDRHANRVTPNLAGPHHQHLFCIRLDFAIDGTDNSVYEVDTVAAPLGSDNPYAGAMVVHETLIGRERDGRRMVDPLKGRYWKIVNPRVHNRLGQPVAYKLMPHNGPVLLPGEESSIGRRAEFARSSLWVSRFEPGELRAAGDYPNLNPGPMGLPVWTAADRDLVEADIVLWHTIGTSHTVRPEDWPVMPVEYIGFTLKPVGFFERNPAIDVPAPVHDVARHEHHDQ